MSELWKSVAQSLYDEGLTYVEISEVIKEYFPNEPAMRVYNKVRSLFRNNKANKAKSSHTNKKSEIKASSQNNPITQNFSASISKFNWDGSTTIKFAVVSDTHINNKCTQLSALHNFYDLCYKAGIKDVYHVGDIDDGELMRTGHQYECYNQGGDAHIAHIVDAYPKVDGMTTYFITGNHDASIYKRCGIDIGHQIASRRSDMKYLGPDTARVKLTNNCIMDLRHPWDGTAYAISYKSQKLVESYDDTDKPDILLLGHYHKQEYIWYKGVQVFQAASFCAQTNFMKGKGISAAVGGWIIELTLDPNGRLLGITPSFVPYKSIIDDYKNFI